MAYSNTETIYFCLAALTFFIWAFLAGLLFKLENRYIGISFTAGTIAVVYLYVISRLKSSQFLIFEDFRYANLKFYKEAIIHALEMKKKLRSPEFGEAKVLIGGGGSNYQKALLS